MLKIYRFFVSEQHANVDVNVNVMKHANINGIFQKYIELSIPLMNYT